VKLPKAVFRYVEHELYNYDHNLELIKQFQDDVIYAQPTKEVVPNVGYISDPTSKKAIKLVSSDFLLKMLDRINRINRALQRLGDDHRTIFELKYRQGLKWQQVCEEMPVAERTYFRLRRELVYMVAVELGLVEGWQE
jgi:RinA family phage transcriptional activator